MQKLSYLFLLSSFIFFGCEQKKINFESANIQASDIEKAIKSGQNIVLKNKTILGDFNLALLNPLKQNSISARTYIDQSLVFSNCTFKGKIISFLKKEKAYFFVQYNKPLTFESCNFKDTVFFQEANIMGDFEISESIFMKHASFEGAWIQRNLIFRKNKYEENAYFQRTRIDGTSNFLNNEFKKAAMFSNTHFGQTAHFGDIIVNGYADFSEIQAKEDIIFTYAKFHGDLAIIHAAFFSDFNFNKVVCDKKAELKKIKVHNITNMQKSTFSIKPDFNFSDFGYFNFDSENQLILDAFDTSLKTIKKN